MKVSVTMPWCAELEAVRPAAEHSFPVPDFILDKVKTTGLPADLCANVRVRCATPWLAGAEAETPSAEGVEMSVNVDRIVAMTTHNGRLYVATASAVYRMVEGGWELVEMVVVPEKARPSDAGTGS